MDPSAPILLVLQNDHLWDNLKVVVLDRWSPYKTTLLNDRTPHLVVFRRFLVLCEPKCGYLIQVWLCTVKGYISPKISIVTRNRFWPFCGSVICYNNQLQQSYSRKLTLEIINFLSFLITINIVLIIVITE